MKNILTKYCLVKDKNPRLSYLKETWRWNVKFYENDAQSIYNSSQPHVYDFEICRTITNTSIFFSLQTLYME